MSLVLGLLALVVGVESAAFQLIVLTTEGGINPGEVRLTLESDGTVALRTWRLAQNVPVVESWTVSTDVVDAVAQALEAASFTELPAVLNEASGAVVAFSTSIEVRRGDDRRTVTAYRHGSPPPPEAFVTLAKRIRELLLASRPSPSDP